VVLPPHAVERSRTRPRLVVGRGNAASLRSQTQEDEQRAGSQPRLRFAAWPPQEAREARHSGALKHLLEEFTLWTALWAGFPLSDELDLRKRALPAPHGRESDKRRDSSMNDDGRAA
jgi:hypothetical protein